MRIVIIGGGIGGLTAALALRREGFEPEVFEQAPALLEVGAAIAVWPNAMRVLARLGVAGAVIERAGQLTEARWLNRDGKLFNRIALPAGDAPAAALHRADLQGALLRALPPDSVHLGRRFAGFEQRPDGVRALFADGAPVSCEVLICADGLHSPARAQLLGDGPPVYRGYATWRGVTTLEHAALAPHVATEVYGRGSRFGIGPVGLGRTGWWATFNEPAEAAEAPHERRRKLLRLFGDWCAPVPELIEATPDENILRNVTCDRPPAGRWGEGRVTLLGDAAHPVTPNLGQGGCLAIEDAAVLARCLTKYADAARALRSYEAHRRARAARIGRYSSLYGKIGQWQGRAAARLRGSLLSAIPEPVGQRLLRLIFDYDAYAVEV
jgi:2-polyprenyl-6-methoxyphenol hydroxylase-like FAD-dependent oxidoreductase